MLAATWNSVADADESNCPSLTTDDDAAADADDDDGMSSGGSEELDPSAAPDVVTRNVIRPRSLQPRSLQPRPGTQDLTGLDRGIKRSSLFLKLFTL